MRGRGAALTGMAILGVIGVSLLVLRVRSADRMHTTLAVTYGDIAEVRAYPVPEGTGPPPLVAKPSHNEVPLSSARSYVPTRLPAPVRCDYSGDGDGLQLRITLRDGRELDYYACAFPPQLQALYDHAWTARSAG